MSIRSPREMIVDKNFWSRELGGSTLFYLDRLEGVSRFVEESRIRRYGHTLFHERHGAAWRQAALRAPCGLP